MRQPHSRPSTPPSGMHKANQMERRGTLANVSPNFVVRRYYGFIGLSVKGIGFRGVTPMMENQMAKNMEHEMEAGNRLAVYSDSGFSNTPHKPRGSYSRVGGASLVIHMNSQIWQGKQPPNKTTPN